MLIKSKLTPEEMRLAFMQMYEANREIPSRIAADEEEDINRKMQIINELKSQGVSAEKLNPYVLQLMEKKATLMQQRPHLESMDEEEKSKPAIRSI